MDALLHALLTPPKGALPGSSPWTIAASSAACWAAFQIMHTRQLLMPRGRLTWKDRVEWANRMVSSLHAVLLVAGSVICTIDSLTYSREQCVAGYTFWPDFFARIFLGYILYDLTAMLLYYKAIGDNSSIIHHILFTIVTSYVLAASVMALPFTWLALGEVSTPMVNARWHLAVLGKKDCKAYLANGMALVAAFFLARIVCYGAGMVHLWSLRDVWGAEGAPAFNAVVVAVLTLGYLLNLYWMHAIGKGALRAMQRSTRKAD